MYDEIATLYHLIYPDWNAAIAQQAVALDAIIRKDVGPPPRSILDVSCGIGTQALGLAALGHAVTASDLSSTVVVRSALRKLTPVAHPYRVMMALANRIGLFSLLDDDQDAWLLCCLPNPWTGATNRATKMSSPGYCEPYGERLKSA